MLLHHSRTAPHVVTSVWEFFHHRHKPTERTVISPQFSSEAMVWRPEDQHIQLPLWVNHHYHHQGRSCRFACLYVRLSLRAIAHTALFHIWPPTFRTASKLQRAPVFTQQWAKPAPKWLALPVWFSSSVLLAVILFGCHPHRWKIVTIGTLSPYLPAGIWKG